LVPPRFLFRLAHPCRYAREMPLRADDRLLDLAEEYRIENFAAMDGQRNFADVRLAWNELGLGLQVAVRGKEQLRVGNVARPGGYLLEAFLPAAALHGYDPEQHPRLGFFYSVRDEELGEQLLSLTLEFPFWEDPSLWSVLELVR